MANKIITSTGRELDANEVTTSSQVATAIEAGQTILQVASMLTDVQSTQTLTATDLILNDMTLAVTPKGTNSRFKIEVRWFGEVDQPQDTMFNITMDDVRVNVTGTGQGIGLSPALTSYYNNNSSTPEMVTFSTLVSSNSVIGTPINLSLVASVGAPNKVIWNNRCFAAPAIATEVGSSELIITEIKGA